MNCHNCGAEHKEGAKFCSECGARLTRGSATYEERQLEKEFSFIHKMLIVIIIVIIALAIALLLLVMHLGAGACATTVLSSSTTSASTTTMAPRVLNPSRGITYSGNIEYSANTTLTGDVATSEQILIDRGVTLTTNGHSMFAGKTFNNSGAIYTGIPGNTASLGIAGQSYLVSYGGSGGSGGGGGGTASPGSTPPTPALTNSLIQTWYSGNMTRYLTGAGGGGGCPNRGYSGDGGSTLAAGGVYKNRGSLCSGVGNFGGSGSYGIYIQAYKIIAGTITATGQNGFAGKPDSGGGGGGGVVVLSYGNGGLTKGKYYVGGGIGATDGAAGGSGQVLNYSYGSSPPITFS